MNNAQVFSIIVEVLRHIKTVQSDVKDLSFKSAASFSEALKNSNLEDNNDVLCALQYQDIISQQLSATMEAIDSIDKSISMWLHAFHNDSAMLEDGLLRLDEKLKISLEEAKHKKAAFTGRGSDTTDEIEFF